MMGSADITHSIAQRCEHLRSWIITPELPHLNFERVFGAPMDRHVESKNEFWTFQKKYLLVFPTLRISMMSHWIIDPSLHCDHFLLGDCPSAHSIGPHWRWVSHWGIECSLSRLVQPASDTLDVQLIIEQVSFDRARARKQASQQTCMLRAWWWLSIARCQVLSFGFIILSVFMGTW